jgi:hypothetical protein
LCNHDQTLSPYVQTHTDYKTLNPKWNKTFHFPVRDITAQLEVTVYDEDRDHKSDFLGRIIIPLWRIYTAEKKWYRLKNRKLGKGARGKNPQILLEMELIWNPVGKQITIRVYQILVDFANCYDSHVVPINM